MNTLAAVAAPIARLSPPPRRVSTPRNAPHTVDIDAPLVARLRRGDAAAFDALVGRYHDALIRMAGGYVPDRGVAEEVVQETWIAVIDGLERFEGHSSLRTWIFGILINKAKDRGARERRCVPFSSLGGSDDEDALEPSIVDAAADDAAFCGSTTDGETPEKLLASRQTVDAIERAIEGLPPSLREVLVMRDIEGMEACEICGVLQITSGNLHVRLHRAREQLRVVLAAYLEGERETPRQLQSATVQRAIVQPAIAQGRQVRRVARNERRLAEDDPARCDLPRRREPSVAVCR